jgi:two-component system chemotaxis response regulator CheY
MGGRLPAWPVPGSEHLPGPAGLPLFWNKRGARPSVHPEKCLWDSAGLTGSMGDGRGDVPEADPDSSRLVLVVDDDPDILEALSEILEAEGYLVSRARNGQEALDRLEESRPALILLDLMMPVMDGWEFARRLRERHPPQDRPPIIVLSADRNVATKAPELGAVGFLAKPFELPDLLKLVQDITGRSP